MTEINILQNNSTQPLTELTAQQKHDLKAALLSVKWAAELLEVAEDTPPPFELIAAHLRKTHEYLTPFIEAILAQNKG